MREKPLEPHVILCSVDIRACEGGQWQKALALMWEVPEKLPEPHGVR